MSASGKGRRQRPKEVYLGLCRMLVSCGEERKFDELTCGREGSLTITWGGVLLMLLGNEEEGVLAIVGKWRW